MTIKQAINSRFIEAVEHLVKTKRVKSRAKLTQELNVNLNTFSEIKSGRSNVQIDVVIKLCDLYNIPLLYILKGETTIEDSMDYLTEFESSVIIGCTIATFKKFYSDKLKRFNIKNQKEILFDKEEVLNLKKELTNA